MAFGQQSGPPASAKQVAYLLALVKQAGHSGFRDARGPLALTQRQAGGKFTVGEASELIDRLVNDGGGDGSTPPDVERTAERATARQAATQIEVLRGVPAHLLVAELERRGYAVQDPSD